MNPYALRRGAVAALSTGLILLVGAVPASAHVRVTADSAAPGGYSKVTFRVPDERPDSATVKVEIALPAGQPMASVAVKPVPGWTVTTHQSKLAKPLKAHGGEITSTVSRIVWSGGKIQPGQFQEFEINLGPLPEEGDSVMFKALQTYDNGEVVRWIDAPAADGSEPEHPAPVLQLVEPTGSSATAGSSATVADSASSAVKEAVATTGTDRAATLSSSADDGAARFLGAAALAVALLAVVFSLVTRNRPSRGSRS